MHISTKALSVILLSIIGGSQTAHAIEYEDAYGATHYGLQCEDRVYTKPVIFAAAKNFCDKLPRQADLKYPTFPDDGYRSLSGYKLEINKQAARLLAPYSFYTPIFTDGTLFAYESDSPKKSAGKHIRKDPGPDRLVVDRQCNIMGAFTDQDYKMDINTARVKVCRVLNSKEDINHFVQSPERSPQRSRENSPERSPQRSRENSPERSPQRSRENSPERSPQRSREQTLE